MERGRPVPRRFLPSISLLSAFEAVYRLGTTAAAARELNITQGAVSRLVLQLERQLDVNLFYRDQKKLVPTRAAVTYASDIQKALDIIAKSSISIGVNPGGGTLNLALLPTFGTRWLAPRLPRFLNANPGVSINISTRLGTLNFKQERVDAALHFGLPEWSETRSMRLFDERMLACCAPTFLETTRLETVTDVANVPLLFLDSRAYAWTTWFEHYGYEGTINRGMLFDQFSTMIQASIHGLGIALLPEFIANIEIEEGRLVCAFGGPTPGYEPYYLVWHNAQNDYAPLIAFRTWLDNEVEDLRSLRK